MQVENQLNALTQRNDWVSLSHEDSKTQAQGWNWGYVESKPQSPFSRQRRKRDLCVYIYIFIGCNLFDRLNIMWQPLLLQCLSWRYPLTAYVWFMMCYLFFFMMCYLFFFVILWQPMFRLYYYMFFFVYSYSWSCVNRMNWNCGERKIDNLFTRSKVFDIVELPQLTSYINQT